jgi:adenylate kinase family enzyme
MGNYCRVAFTFFFQCSEAVMESRLLERGKTSGRSDDNAESIRKRFKTYSSETAPIIQLFTERKMCREINCDRDVDAVYQDVRSQFLTI